VWDIVGPQARALVAIGRLDLATSGLLLLTSDTRLSDWICDPANEVPRVYAVSVRGRIVERDRERLMVGVESDGEVLRAAAAELRKASARESHLIIEIKEGRNREVRRLFASIGHEVMRLKRVGLGGLELGSVEPGQWRNVTAAEIVRSFPGAPVSVRSGRR
jgi:23S rRNA pseudouridine2605 synthase